MLSRNFTQVGNYTFLKLHPENNFHLYDIQLFSFESSNDNEDGR